ncbi:twin-arginine translocase subunit TatC [Tahibacter soli]|jgi:sec-independent protein translocase protein TatC|uniref:Sec-independent protein translocase protein TatC n=1 Tax=Tahibacter soli TaxID=2983605 RepID=A0A9X3YNW8_9GAMM|nr:twin-arginine translocase subunit TatC [Tahibacter soli]MDC8014223.1 twin-arginine translocase subunit TatC [Tahibacter soli]
MSAPDEEGGEASFFSHLIELRERLLKALVAVGIVLLALLPFANKLYGVLAEPLLRNLPAGGQLVAIEVASPFFTPLKLAFFTALVVAMPAVLYQLWAFVAPGLYRHEKRLAMPILASSVFLFYLGCAFAYFLVLPTVFAFLAKITPQGVAMMTDISKYLDFVLVIFFAFGLCFEVPVAVVILVALGWVTPKQLVEARGYVIVGAFVVAAVLTPPDVVSQILLAVPMCVLYEVGVVAARTITKRTPPNSVTS